MTAEKPDEAGMTVGLGLVFPEGAFVELSETEDTDKMFRVESLAPHGRDAPALDWL